MLNFSIEAEKYREEFLQLLEQWVSIKSVYDSESICDNRPFGEGVDKALKWFINIGNSNGFVTKNVDGFAAHIEYGIGGEYVYAFGHCDVVPEGDGWSSSPYKLSKTGDKLVGRGVIDDKGPVLAAYLALKLLKENNIKLNRRIRVVAGGNEENGFRCIRHYFESEPWPTYGFTPDAKFPVINGEMGAAVINISGNIGNKDLVVLGGEVHNTIPDYVIIKNCNIDEKSYKIRELLKSESLECNYFNDGIKLIGIGGHSSKPERANNPIEKCFKLLNSIMEEKWSCEFDKLFSGGNLSGTIFGLNIRGKCGTTKIVPTIIKIDKGIINLQLSVRYPELFAAEEIRAAIKDYFIEQGLNDYCIYVNNIKSPNYVDENSPLVKKLYNIYVKHTGDITNKVRVTSAGTYASEMKNSVIFGGEFPNGSSGNAHMANEYGSEDAFIKSIGIYAEAFYELCKL
ncbi:Sapep family Mn(2+)-dependent dipeptidase [Clostridium omnivorum]|uniref:Peptidase n=1 Tax=Clostridium omnivorum TaxID=1604902 RepID=A0ABQ5N2G9_9CLOT|nr:Sapep family Mn(2+)-dependent dipeptidase [Clostridium sp. E14]GLC29402.1 peptidase [Clostridium sp. E14]